MFETEEVMFRNGKLYRKVLIVATLVTFGISSLWSSLLSELYVISVILSSLIS